MLHPQSDGNFHHLKKCIEFLLNKNDKLLLDFIYNRSCPLTSKPYVIKFLSYCHHSTIQDIILNLVFMGFKRDLKYVRKDRFTQLLEMEFVKEIVQLMESRRPEIVQGACELFLRLVEEGSKIDDAHILFMSWMSDKSLITKMIEVRHFLMMGCQSSSSIVSVNPNHLVHSEYGTDQVIRRLHGKPTLRSFIAFASNHLKGYHDQHSLTSLIPIWILI